MQRITAATCAFILLALSANAQSTKHRYANAQNGVTFEYSTEWRAVDADKDTHYMRPSIQPVQAAFILDPDPAPYPGTDFASLAFNYIISSDKTAAACRNAINPYGDAASAPSVTVNGRIFDAANAGDFATGHQITERLYSTFANNRCYVFDLELVTAGFGAADDQDIRQMFQSERDDAQKKLDAIFGTVKIEKLTH